MTPAAPAAAVAAAPRLGFLGVGWIGRHRMRALLEAGVARAVALVDTSEDAARAALAEAPGCERAGSLDDLLARGVDGVVVATPSALHADQAVRALEAGVPVFCQKPLGRSAAEARRVVDAARAADRLLGVDLSYRHVAGLARLRDDVRAGALGEVYAARLAFHNAYGPDKAWFRDPALSGGGCLVDLGIHLVDLALWVLGDPEVRTATASLHAGGRPVKAGAPGVVEDHAVALLELGNGATVELACSWWLPAGRDCELEVAFYGTRGGAVLRNVEGSFLDFALDRTRGTARERVASPPDAWGGRAAVAWARALAAGGRFDPEVASVVKVQATLDRLYGR
ncbi:MAG: Gfo/Idh/MocA family oxidoreductase [Anaeromyxobacteraceae bacterium]